VGPLSQFWEEDRFFKNSHALGHRLNLINRDIPRVNSNGRILSEFGHLKDDTTLITGRQLLRQE